MHPLNVLTAWVLNAHEALVQAGREARLEPRDLAALTLVAEYDGQSIDWLRGRVGLTQSATVRLVDRLQAAELVRRTRADGRTVALSVTLEGRARLESWHAARRRALDDALVGLAPAEREALAEILARTLACHPRELREADATCRGCDWPACGDDCPVASSIVADG